MLALRRDATQVRRQKGVLNSPVDCSGRRAPACFEALPSAWHQPSGSMHERVCRGSPVCRPHPPSPPQVNHEDFNEAITEVQAKKKASLQYYA